MAVPPGSTPKLLFSLPDGYDLSEAEHIYLTFKYAEKTLTKTDNDIHIESVNRFYVELTQQETLMFPDNVVAKVQLNWIESDGKRGTTAATSFKMGEQLIRKVLP